MRGTGACEVFFWIPPRSEKTLLGVHTVRNPTDDIVCGKYNGTDAQAWAWDGHLVRKNERPLFGGRLTSVLVGLRAVSPR